MRLGPVLAGEHDTAHQIAHALQASQAVGIDLEGQPRRARVPSNGGRGRTGEPGHHHRLNVRDRVPLSGHRGRVGQLAFGPPASGQSELDYHTDPPLSEGLRQRRIDVWSMVGGTGRSVQDVQQQERRQRDHTETEDGPRPER